MRVGDRVRLHAPSATLHLSVETGTIVRPDLYHELGYWVVRLDGPATCHGVTLTEVVEMDDNLTVIDAWE